MGAVLMIDELYAALTTLTDEAEQAALQKCKELSFDTNRGIVSLDESFINLNSARDILLDAIEKRKLVQLPITIQQVLRESLAEVSRGLTALVGGTDEVVNLSTSIEQLNTSIWQYGLHNLSEEVLGYQTKLNQLKTQELELRQLRQELEAGLSVKATLQGLVESVNQSVAHIQNNAETTEKQASGVSERLAVVIETDQKASAALASIQQSEASSTQFLASTTRSNADVLALQPQITDFFNQISGNRATMTETISDAKNAIKQYKEETDNLLGELRKLEDQIKVQIQKATGFSLFHSFQTRQEALRRSKNQWSVTLFVLLLCSVGLTAFLVKTLQQTTSLNVEFFLKLSFSLPLLVAVGFCIVQYAKERRLEEEYAFKSNISISLVPYQELVQKLVRAENPAEMDKYTNFVIESISKVFTSPTDKIFDAPEKNKGVPAKALKQLAEILGPFVREIKH
jgi:hypothetical protein